MTVPGPSSSSFWPIFDLAIRTPRLEIRLPREDEFGALLALVEQGIYDPGTMPFIQPWTERPQPQRERESAQFWWGARANWSADQWAYTGGVYVEGQLVGVQDMMAKQFAQKRSVTTGSWLGLSHQDQGLGKEMRQAILHLAFAGLGAEEALSDAFFDNAASLATSRSVGYQENGEVRKARRDGSDRTIGFRMDRENWEGRHRNDIELIGLDGCLDMFIGSPGSTP
jgi:RimJ/RimL family protein N-acetyltransferase